MSVACKKVARGIRLAETQYISGKRLCIFQQNPTVGRNSSKISAQLFTKLAVSIAENISLASLSLLHLFLPQM